MTVDERMSAAIAKHMLRMGAGNEDRVSSIVVFPNKTDKDGFTEWLLRYEFVTGGQLVVGAILRNPDQEVVEFHT